MTYSAGITTRLGILALLLVALALSPPPALAVHNSSAF
jgi:hypothetical protein